MKKSQFKKLLLITIPLSMLFGALLGAWLGTKSALTKAEEDLVAAETALVVTKTQLEDKEELNLELMEDLLEARNQLFMIDMYNERDFYMNQEGE